MKTQPFKFQLEDVEQIDRFGGRALISSEVGTGKTLTSLLWGLSNRSARPIVVVCPAHLRWHWERECAKHFSMRARVLEGTKPKRNSLRSGSSQVVIVNYDILGPTKRGPGWLKQLKKLKPQLVIGDEVHFVSCRKSIRSRAFSALCEEAPFILALSATPLTNRPADLYQIIHLLRPDLFRSWWEFAVKHCRPEYNSYGWTFKGADRLDELHAKLTDPHKGLMIRRRKADVLGQIPPVTLNVLPVDIVRPKEYHKAYTDFLNWLRENKGEIKARKAAKAQAVVKVGYLLRLTGELKGPSVKAWIENTLEDIDGEDKLVFFGVHKNFLGPLHQEFKKLCVKVDGSVVGRKRQEAIDQFVHDKRTRLLLGNIKAAGTGWSAKGASHIGVGELPWTSSDLTQALGRAHCIGRGVEGVPTTATILVARGTVEEQMVDLLTVKQATLDATLDGDAQASGFDLMEQLIDKITEKGR